MDYLPLEIAIEISKLLRANDIFSFSLVCKPFDLLLKSEVLWRFAFERDFFSLGSSRKAYLVNNKITWKRLYVEFLCGENVIYSEDNFEFDKNSETSFKTGQCMRNLIETKRNEIIVSFDDEIFQLNEDYHLIKSFKHELESSRHAFEFPEIRKIAIVFINKEIIVQILDIDKFEFDFSIRLPENIDSNISKMFGSISQNVNFVKTRRNKLICVMGSEKKGKNEMIVCEWDIFDKRTVKILFKFKSTSDFCDVKFITEDYFLCNDTEFVDIRKKKVLEKVFPEFPRSQEKKFQCDFFGAFKNHVISSTGGLITIYRHIKRTKKFEKIEFQDISNQVVSDVYYPVYSRGSNEFENICLIESVGRFDQQYEVRDVVMKLHVDFERKKVLQMKWNERNRNTSYGCEIGKTHMSNKFKRKTKESNYTKDKSFLEIQSLNGKTFQKIEIPNSCNTQMFSKKDNKIILLGYFNRKKKDQPFLNVIDWKLKNV